MAAAASHPRIHPVDMESDRRPPTQTEPLYPRGSSKSDTDPNSSFRRTIPVVYSKPPKRRSCCCRILCWTVSLLLLQIILVAIAGGIIYLVFRPKLPKFTIDRLQITQFNLTSADDTLFATFDVTITARNPNEKIGIYYEGGSNIGVWYRGSRLCEGALPKFYQGHRNTTVMDVMLSGKSGNATGMLTSLQADRQQTGLIPLNLRVKQPVRIKLGKLKLMKVKFLVRCRLDVDSLSADNVISIKNNRCKYRLRL